MYRFLLLQCMLFFLFSCNDTKEDIKKNISNCVSCHSQYRQSNKQHFDATHQFDCIVCHQGNNRAKQQENAHQGLITSPTHPRTWQSCIQCHKKEIDAITTTPHYTLAPAANRFRKAFGAKENVAGFWEIHPSPEPNNILELADDALRRRCFRCHLFSHGDDYDATRHGTGCAACHGSPKRNDSISYIFTKPTDKHCLSCHYGNVVGMDYYGRFEYDYHKAFHPPLRFSDNGKTKRKYGISYMQLSPDIHQHSGLQCIDCHNGTELMANGDKPRCSGCHDAKKLEVHLPNGVMKNYEKGWQFLDSNNTLHPLPIMQHSAHDIKGIDCQVCHAQWSFNDKGKHLLRSDSDTYDIFNNLTAQGSSEVEEFILHNINFNNIERKPLMTDTISGEKIVGVWYKSLGMRRWNLSLDYHNDTLTVVRPLLDYHLSWVDADDDVIFDSISTRKKIYQPYTPHTTGHAGLFYMERIINAQIKREQKETKDE